MTQPVATGPVPAGSDPLLAPADPLPVSGDERGGTGSHAAPGTSTNFMNWPYELRVGWRYTRAGRAGRRNGFISFISFVSVLGIALGVAALIIVLSVMNGFQKEVRDRMLAAIAHVEVFDVNGAALADWQAVAAKMKQNPQVQAAAPYVATQALVAHGEEMRGALVRGILPAEEAHVTPLADRMKGTLEKLTPGSWNVAIGAYLARALGVQAGDAITIVTPGGQLTPAGLTPRFKQVTVAGVFEVGHYQYDSTFVFMHLDDAARLFRTEGPVGVQLRLADLQQARDVAAELQRSAGPQLRVRDWTRSNAEWFDAVQIEKTMMFIILTLIVAVAAFNLVSTLVMTVTDKQSDIAILRTLGASPGSVMGIFMVQGAASGVIGTLSGVGLGVLVAANIDVIVPFIESVLGMSFLPAQIYLISKMPSDPRMSDIVPIGIISLVLAFVATIYPSWRASRVQPAEALRYE
jgi:lipoprotein-releasing system permease protein